MRARILIFLLVVKSVLAIAQRTPVKPVATDTAAKKNSGGVSINFGGIGIHLGGGGAKKTVPACGQISAVTRILCAGTGAVKGGNSYYITMKFTNTPYDGVKACTYTLTDVKVLSKGTISDQSTPLPLVIASTASAIYTFKYTPTNNTDDAQFDMFGAWDNKAEMPDLKPVIKLPACVTCDCGKWDDMTVAGGAANLKYNAAERIVWKCGQVFKFSTSYQCSAGVVGCMAQTRWDIAKDGVNIKQGKGENTAGDEFIPSGNGAYTISLTANCGGVECATAVYTLVVSDCQTDVSGTPVVNVNPPVAIPPSIVPPPVTINLSINVPAKKPDSSNTKKQQVVPSAWYYVIRPEYSGEVVNVADTLYLQIENSYSTASNQFTYSISNLASNKTSPPARLAVANNQGMIRVALPLQASVVAAGEAGLLVLNDYKKHYYINFKRSDGIKK